MAGKYDDMSFGKAFAAARKAKGAGKTFTWKGKSYTTDYKEEAKKPAKKTAPKSSPRPKARKKAEPPTATKVTTPKVTTRRLSPAGTSGRGDGAKEVKRRRTDALIDMADKALKSPKSYSYKEWKSMSRAERKAAGLPVSVIGGELGFKRFKTGLTGKDYKMTPGAAPKPKPASPGSRGRNRGRTGAAYGGMMKKKAKK